MSTELKKRRFHRLVLVSMVPGAVSAALLGVGFWKSDYSWILVGGIGSAFTFVVAWIGNNRARISGTRGAWITASLSALSVLGCLTILVYPACDSIRMAASNAKSMNNLKQLGLAIHNYNDTYHRLPPQAIRDKDGRPLLSWRVAILPLLQQDALYKQFKLDEPWDCPHNRALLSQMPQIFASPGPNRGGPHETYYQVLVGPHTAFERDGLRIPISFPDGTSYTIMVVEAAHSVPWTKPEDIEFNDEPLISKLGGRSRTKQLFWGEKQQQYYVLMCDGTTQGVGSGAEYEAILRAMATRDGDEAVKWPWEK